MSETTVHVPIEGAPYDVVVGNGILSGIGRRVRSLSHPGQAFVVTDTNVGPLYLEQVVTSLEEVGIQTTTHTFMAGEQSKTIDTWARICRAMAASGCDRDTVVIALGGGVTGDMAGFAAASFMRGVRLVQVPTSLLAMVDSSVGGKTAIDVPEGKNLVGAFLQPKLVLADIACLATLSGEQFADACGEVIKHAVLADDSLFTQLEHHPLTDGDYTPEELAETVAKNVAIKRNVVVEDEREQGLRQTLNLGHTLGHAIEAASDYSLGHGACVAAGLCMVVRAAAELGWCAPKLAWRIEACVEAHGLPTGSDVDPNRIVELACHDKKRHANGVNLVVPRDIGICDIRRVSFEDLAAIVVLGQERR